MGARVAERAWPTGSGGGASAVPLPSGAGGSGCVRKSGLLSGRLGEENSAAIMSYSGYEDYNYGYGYNQDNSGNYGYDTYESYDSRSSMNDRDLYRSGYDYSEAEHDTDNAYEGHYDNSYGNRRDQYHNRARDNFGHRGQNWTRDGRNKRPMVSAYSGRMGGEWNEPPGPMGGRGHGPNRPPSLFSHKLFPEYNMYQGMRGFSGNMRFGGGGMKQRMRGNWKMWDADFKKKRIKNEPTANKRKQGNSSDEPDSKAAKTDGSDNSDSDNGESILMKFIQRGLEEKEGEGEGGEDEERKGDSEKGALTIQEEISQIKRKLQAGKKTQERQKKRFRDRMVERIQFVCSFCKYRTFYEDEMTNHLESKFHQEHFTFVGTKLPQQTADFLQEYVANKMKKTEERRNTFEDVNRIIQQIYKDQDLTQDIGMEHFLKKVEAAHCAACDLFIPMQYGMIQKHIKSIDHNHNRRAMMEQSKRSSLVVARSILNNKLISKKLERYLKGENPFTDDPEEKEEHEEGEARTSGIMEEGAVEGEESKTEEEAKGGDSLTEENTAEGNAENKDGEGEESSGQMEEWNLKTSQEALAKEQEHDDANEEEEEEEEE
uniref:A-kinase anchoring protein 8 like n=1 Tax=Anolis carolinensis TaxID=28377 RepID=A0A803T6Y3_ANOCA